MAILLCDIGNTHTHVAVAGKDRILRRLNFQTPALGASENQHAFIRLTKGLRLEGAAICSVVPWATGPLVQFVTEHFNIPCQELSSSTITGVGIDYPKPESIGADRLANAIAVKTHFGAPSVVVDFGTAVTFDVVNRAGNYAGGIIAPGLAAMTEYLHEKTALLPQIKIRETNAIIGKNTKEAMLIGAVHGYRGLVRELIKELKRELGVRRLPVVATGGYARLIAAKLPEISSVMPELTLEGLRLAWGHWHPAY